MFDGLVKKAIGDAMLPMGGMLQASELAAWAQVAKLLMESAGAGHALIGEQLRKHIAISVDGFLNPTKDVTP